jgi:hypothetical protein
LTVLIGDRETVTSGYRWPRSRRKTRSVIFAGVVELGVGPRLIAALEIIERKASPFASARLPRTARFVEPRLVADVQYLAGSDALRHAAIRAVRVRDR